MPVAAGSSDRELTLSQVPNLPLVFEDDSYMKTGFIIAKNSATRKDVFLIKERELNDKATFNVQGINYDDRYYQNDGDFIDGVVDVLGNPI